MQESKADWRAIGRLAWPAIVQEALATLVVYADTAMVGALGANASAAVGLTATVGWLVSSLAGVAGVGVLSVCAQADGAGDEALLNRAGQQALFLTLFTGALLTAVCLGIAPFLAGWLGGDEAIRADATAYFTIVSIPLVFRAAVLTLSGALRGVSDMKTPMLIGLIMNGVNIVLNFFLIFPSRRIGRVPVYGAGLGVRGAAIATAVSLSIGGMLMFLRFVQNPRFGFRRTGFHPDRAVLSRCLSIALPVALQRGVICFGHILFSSLIARLGVVPLAAHTIAIQAEQAFYVPGYGLQAAAATLAGNAAGEGNERKLRRTGFLLSAAAALLMLAAGALLFFLAPALMRLFAPDEAVVRLGAAVLRIVSVSEPVYGVLVVLEGVFNGMGDTRPPVLYAVCTSWGVRVLGSALMIYGFHLGLRAVWVMMVLDNTCRCLLLLRRFRSGKWRQRLAIARAQGGAQPCDLEG